MHAFTLLFLTLLRILSIVSKEIYLWTGISSTSVITLWMVRLGLFDFEGVKILEGCLGVFLDVLVMSILLLEVE